MLYFTLLGLLFFIVDFSTLVVGQQELAIIIDSVQVTNNDNEYFNPWDVEIIKTDKSSRISVKMPTKKELPDSMQVILNIELSGQDPMEQVVSFCDGLDEETVGKSFVNAGVPKDDFPKQCPFVDGDWSIFEWEPPSDALPQGIPDGPMKGFVSILEEGKDPYVKIDYQGELIHV